MLKSGSEVIEKVVASEVSRALSSLTPSATALPLKWNGSALDLCCARLLTQHPTAAQRGPPSLGGLLSAPLCGNQRLVFVPPHAHTPCPINPRVWLVTPRGSGSSRPARMDANCGGGPSHVGMGGWGRSVEQERWRSAQRAAYHAVPTRNSSSCLTLESLAIDWHGGIYTPHVTADTKKLNIPVPFSPKTADVTEVHTVRVGIGACSGTSTQPPPPPPPPPLSLSSSVLFPWAAPIPIPMSYL